MINKKVWEKDTWLDFTEVPDTGALIEKLSEHLEHDGYICKVLEGAELKEWLIKEGIIGGEEAKNEIFPLGYTVLTKGNKRLVIIWKT